MTSYEASLRIAQRQHDALLAAGPPDDPMDDAWQFAAEATRADLEAQQMIAWRLDDSRMESFWFDRLCERPDPSDIDLFVLPDEDIFISIYNDAEARDWAIWPTWLEAVCPGYTRAAALAAARQALRDTRHWLHEDYIP
jgi:hypothetical protein